MLKGLTCATILRFANSLQKSSLIFEYDGHGKGLLSGYLAVVDSLGKGVPVNAKFGGGADQVPVVSFQDLGDEAFLEVLRSFGKQNSPFDHFPADVLEALLETERLF